MSEQIDLDEIEERNARATSALAAVCQRGWKMHVSVPARPDQDDDIVISASIQDVPGMIAELRAARARVLALESAAVPLLAFMRTLPEDALGRDPELGFAYRDEAIDSLERAIRAHLDKHTKKETT